jgi:hypothetical protein
MSWRRLLRGLRSEWAIALGIGAGMVLLWWAATEIIS